MQIHIIGQYPPPIGGITIHIKRLVNKLQTENFDLKYFDDTDLPPMSFLIKIKNIFRKNPYAINGIYRKPKQYEYKDTVRLNSFAKYFMNLVFKDRKKIKIVHYHTKYWKYRALLSLAQILNKKVRSVITIHSMRDEYSDLRIINRLYLKITISKSSHLIVTNSEIEQKLIDCGCDQNKITVLHPYLKPQKNQKDYEEIADEVWEFINTREPIISANASKIEFYKDEDLYGLDLCVELCHRLKSKYDNIGFVFCLPLIAKEDYFEELQKKIVDYNIEKNFLFVVDSYEFYPFLEKSDVFVRPTNTDGDALSIREALSMKIPTVSSNAIERPSGTVIFENRNIDDFEDKVYNIIAYGNGTVGKKNSHTEDQSFNEIVKIYKKVAEKK